MAIVTVCSFGFLAAPVLMRALRSVAFGGNFLAGMMASGFTALCYVEGGMRGHAVAWLASVPLCALLLVGKKSAGIWVIISFASASIVVALEIAEIEMPFKYDMAWHPLINSAGYLGLIGFMFALGLIFEVGREQAFGKMTDAVDTLAAANERLVVLSKDKTEFLGIAAHDLRNPLTIIISYADLLRDPRPTNDVPAFSQTIYDAGTRMRDLIVNLLDSNAIEEGQISTQIERCEIAELIAQSVQQNQMNAQRKRDGDPDFRAGFEFAVTETLSARAGYSYARSPVPNETLTPLTGAIFEHSVSAGLGYRWGRFRTDFAWQWRLPVTQRVGRSALLAGVFSQTSFTLNAHLLQLTTGVEL